MTKCNVCGGTAFHENAVEEVFHVDGQVVMVEGIPARICDRCGDATFSRETTEAVRRMVHGESRPKRTVNVNVFAFA